MADNSLWGSINRSVGNTFGVGIEEAITADHTPTGPEAVIWHAMEAYMFVGGVMTGPSAGSRVELGIDLAGQEAIGKGVELGAGLLFRGESTRDVC